MKYFIFSMLPSQAGYLFTSCLREKGNNPCLILRVDLVLRTFYFVLGLQEHKPMIGRWGRPVLCALSCNLMIKKKVITFVIELNREV